VIKEDFISVKQLLPRVGVIPEVKMTWNTLGASRLPLKLPMTNHQISHFTFV
jgi:hypothetical protein